MKTGAQLLDHVTKSMEIVRDLKHANVIAFMPNGEIYQLVGLTVRAGGAASEVTAEQREGLIARLRKAPPQKS